MWIVLIIIAIIIVYCVFVKAGNNIIDNSGITDEKDKENVWWTLGMFSDIRNKNRKNN